jgi:hypothetical protein
MSEQNHSVKSKKLNDIKFQDKLIATTPTQIARQLQVVERFVLVLLL